MLLKKILIRNFGTFNSDSKWIELGGKIATIIGENGTGKSTILYAINLLLDKKRRRRDISIEWIPNIEEETYIKYVFDSRDFKELGVVLPIEENQEIHIEINLKFNSDIKIFSPIIYIGKMEKIQFSPLQQLPFDKYIEIIHIKSTMDNNIDELIEKNFTNKTFENIKILMNELNKYKYISRIPEITNFNMKINEELCSITKKKNFPILLEANIQLTKISKTLNIFHMKNNKRIMTHGDGYKKIISVLSNIKKANDDKIKLIIIDELENNLFYTYQSRIIDYFNRLISNKNKNHFGQVIIVTHSPNIVKITPNTSITKLRNNGLHNHFKCNEKMHYDFYQKELSTAIFYDKILIVEGHSEKMFFEYLMKYNECLKDICDTSEIFILNNQGCDFNKVFSLLRSLSTKVVVLTDNDVWPTKNPEYQGVKRILKLLPNEIQNQYPNIDFSKKCCINESSMKSIIMEGKEYNIFTQEEYGYTFEDSLKHEGLINEKQMENLKSSKLKSLASNMERISNNLNYNIIKNSKYLFEWVKVFNK